MRQLIVAEHDPENVILMEIDPDHQKTLPDFLITQRELGIAIVDILSLKKRGNQLFYRRDGREIEVRRIYNRCIVDELERKGITLPFDFRDELDVEWAGHPNWYFRISKFSIPYLKHSCVPKTWFLDQMRELPKDKENYLLKPLYSFAGVGIKFAPTQADIDAIPPDQRHDYILQERVQFEPVIQTPAWCDADGNSHDVRMARGRRTDASAAAGAHGSRHHDGRRSQQESGVGGRLSGVVGLNCKPKIGSPRGTRRRLRLCVLSPQVRETCGSARHLAAIEALRLASLAQDDSAKATAHGGATATAQFGTTTSPVKYALIDFAALRPAPIARITVAPPVTMSPPAKTPGFEVARVSSLAEM